MCLSSSPGDHAPEQSERATIIDRDIPTSVEADVIRMVVYSQHFEKSSTIKSIYFWCQTNKHTGAGRTLDTNRILTEKF